MGHQDISDNELLDRYYRTGDRQLLGALLERYSLLLYGFCSKQLHDSSLARDAVQQVQLRVIENIDRDRVEFFSNWIFTIARNECNQLFRKRRTLYREVMEKDAQQTPPDAHDSLETVKDRLFDQALAALPETQRLCVRLFYLSGERKRYEEVAAETGYTLKEVKTHIQNGKRNMKTMIDKIKNGYS